VDLHSVDAVDPTYSVNLLVGQTAQVEVPTVAEYFPMGQETQLEEAIAEAYFPAAHCVQPVSGAVKLLIVLDTSTPFTLGMVAVHEAPTHHVESV
jgi:hypothetical protein